MSAPFVLEQAPAARPEVAREADPARRVAALCRLILGRPLLLLTKKGFLSIEE
jgi:hypothetical protein